MSVNANVSQWEPAQRRVGSLAALGAALVLVVAGLAVWLLVDNAAAWIYWTLVVLLVLVLAFQLALLFLQPKAASVADAPAAEAPPAAEPAYAAPVAPAPASAPAPEVLTLRCGDCGTVFDVTDTGERPLYHTCPGCGAEGALRAPEQEAAPSPYAPPPAPAPVVNVPAPAPAAPLKKLKLRCGGCKEVFSIEDSGERPLKRPCPHCGRVGIIH